MKNSGKKMGNRNAWIWFVVGLISGVLVYEGALKLNGLTLISRETLDRQWQLVAECEEENQRLSDDLLRSCPGAETQTDE